jgi:hypothetical protein
MLALLRAANGVDMREISLPLRTPHRAILQNAWLPHCVSLMDFNVMPSLRDKTHQ